MKTNQLQSNEYGSYYANYINQVDENTSIFDGLNIRLKEALQLYQSIPEEHFDYRYADGKWSIKEVLHHVIDAERIFAYRALRVARGDKLNLLGFSQDDFVLKAGSNNRTKNALIEEFKSVRHSTISLFESFNDEMLLEIGSASDAPISTRALGYIIIGHEKHHANIVAERYI